MHCYFCQLVLKLRVKTNGYMVHFMGSRLTFRKDDKFYFARSSDSTKLGDTRWQEFV